MSFIFSTDLIRDMPGHMFPEALMSHVPIMQESVEAIRHPAHSGHFVSVDPIIFHHKVILFGFLHSPFIHDLVDAFFSVFLQKGNNFFQDKSTVFDVADPVLKSLMSAMGSVLY